MTKPSSTADLLGRGLARAVGRSVDDLKQRIAALEFQLDVANDPHTRLCRTQATGRGNDCTCGWKDVMHGQP